MNINIRIERQKSNWEQNRKRNKTHTKSYIANHLVAISTPDCKIGTLCTIGTTIAWLSCIHISVCCILYAKLLFPANLYLSCLYLSLSQCQYMNARIRPLPIDMNPSSMRRNPSETSIIATSYMYLRLHTFSYVWFYVLVSMHDIWYRAYMEIRKKEISTSQRDICTCISFIKFVSTYPYPSFPYFSHKKWEL